jgi:hypothetical protein
MGTEIGQLDEFVVREVFGFLAGDRAAQAVACVCSRWARIATGDFWCNVAKAQWGDQLTDVSRYNGVWVVLVADGNKKNRMRR